MKEQLYYEDVEVGSALPELVKRPTIMQLVMWAGASGDYTPIHYDRDVAIEQGLPGVIVHGWLPYSFLGQMITDWIGDRGFLVKIGVSYRGMHWPDEDIICKGKVVNKYVKDGKSVVECEVWAENPKGDKTVPGTAQVILPSREK